jgi:hypothetical protein
MCAASLDATHPVAERLSGVVVEQASKTTRLFTPAQRAPEGSGRGRSRRSEALRGHHVEKSCPWRTLEHGRHLLPESPNMLHGITSRLLIIEEGNNEDFALLVQEPDPLPQAGLSIDRGLVLLTPAEHVTDLVGLDAKRRQSCVHGDLLREVDVTGIRPALHWTRRI